MNRIDNSGTGIAQLGRDEDKYMAHVAQGEMVVPPVISPETKAKIMQEMRAAGLSPDEYTVGDGMSINPITGQPEFGFLKKAWKKVKKVIKKIAPIAAVIPGPWQSFAAIYQKGSAGLRIAKGEGGIGDLMTLAAGGNQKVFGEGGALKNITSGNFKTAGGGFGKAFRNIGSVTDAAGKSSFKPFEYAQEIGSGYKDDLKDSFGGIFNKGPAGGIMDVGGNQFSNVGSSMNNPMGGMMNAAYTPTAGGAVSGANPYAALAALSQSDQQGFNSFFKESQDHQGLFEDSSGNLYDPATMMNEMVSAYQSGGGQPQSGANQTQTSGGFMDFLKRKLLPQSMEDALNEGGLGGLIGGGFKGAIGGINKLTGGNAGAAGIAALLGKTVYDATKDRQGGLAATPAVTMDALGRYSLSKALGTGGTRQEFGLGNAPSSLNFAYGGEARQYFNQGGLAAIAEQDMREGGESEGPGTGTSDDIPAMLSDGEFVMTAAATKGAGAFKLNKTKSGIELISGGKASREKGVENMRELMNIFEAI
tara:strand:- start:477 stop:2072 length:1596 start_codon:yes stop_codon:yes gene_type:complete